MLKQYPMTFLYIFVTLRRGYWYLLLCYVLAKLFEHYDYAIYEMFGFISGHSLKHMVVALGLFVLVRVFLKRENKKGE